MYFITIEPLHCYITQSIPIILIHMFALFQYGLYLWRFLTKCVVVSSESLRVSSGKTVAVITMNGKSVKIQIYACSTPISLAQVCM